MINVSKQAYPEWEQVTTAMSAAIYNSSLGLSFFVSPIYGTSMAKAFGFRITMDSLAAIDLIFLTTYLTFGRGFSGFSQSIENLKSQNRADTAI